MRMCVYVCVHACMCVCVPAWVLFITHIYVYTDVTVCTYIVYYVYRDWRNIPMCACVNDARGAYRQQCERASNDDLQHRKITTRGGRRIWNPSNTSFFLVSFFSCYSNTSIQTTIHAYADDVGDMAVLFYYWLYTCVLYWVCYASLKLKLHFN